MKVSFLPAIKREILLCLAGFSGGLCIFQISKKIGRTYGITCSSLRELKKSGAVIYGKTEEDRKRQIPSLTPLGKEIVKAIHKLERATMDSK